MEKNALDWSSAGNASASDDWPSAAPSELPDLFKTKTSNFDDEGFVPASASLFPPPIDSNNPTTDSGFAPFGDIESKFQKIDLNNGRLLFIATIQGL